MKYAVESRIFDNGIIIAKVRTAQDDEVDRHIETRTCDIWIDIFDSKREAYKFCNGYKNA